MAVIALRVLALLGVLTAIGPGATVLPTLVRGWPYDAEGGSSSLMLASIVAPIILPLVFAGLLWFGAGTLAKRVHAGTTPSDGVFPIEALQAFSFSAIGVFVLALAIPRITTLIYYYWQLSTPGGVQLGSEVERRAAIIETATRLAIGVWLVFGSTGIAAFIRRIRGR
jgi:hypothetical protein